MNKCMVIPATVHDLKLDLKNIKGKMELKIS
jgi:hypothetical protein